MSLFTELHKAAAPLMESFLTDLDHDRKWIDANAGKAFIHITRKSGTELIPMPAARSLIDDTPVPFLFSEAKPSEICRQHLSLMKNVLSKSGLQWMYFDGRRLRGMSAHLCIAAYENCFRRELRRKRESRRAA